MKTKMMGTVKLERMKIDEEGTKGKEGPYDLLPATVSHVSRVSALFLRL